MNHQKSVQRPLLGFVLFLSGMFALAAFADATLDTNFNPGANSGVFSLTLQADGKVLVIGSFTTLAGQACTNLGRLNADGTLDTSFNPGVGGNSYPRVYCLAVQADGKIVVGGSFSSLGGQSRTNIGRLNADGSVDVRFHSGANDTVLSLAVQADGKILVGGDFTTLGGLVRTHIGRLNVDGAVEASFNSASRKRFISRGVFPGGTGGREDPGGRLF